MKEYSNNIWMNTNKDGTVSVGLTQNFIETKLTECFHIMQADASLVKKDGPMLVIETNDGLSSLKSPVTGRILHFNDRARNFPDKLKEDDTIMLLLPDGVKGPKKEKAKPVEVLAEALDIFNLPQYNWEPQLARQRDEQGRRIINEQLNVAPDPQRMQRAALDALANRQRRAR